MDRKQSISDYLIQTLYQHGVKHVFGVAGDYVLGFFHELEKSNIQLINTCDEQGAGFAADAYARLNGLGAVCVTYSVGGLKVTNTTAQAFAEKSPVIVISGAPGIDERRDDPMLHHKVDTFNTQFEVFEHLTVASTLLSDPITAKNEIDRVFEAAMQHKRPVYIELPRDRVLTPMTPSVTTHHIKKQTSDQTPIALALAYKKMAKAQRPVILAGVEIHRYGLQRQLMDFVNNTQIPFATTILSKSVIDETHPLYLGVYEGAMCRDELREYFEQSDCLIMLGVFLTDVNLGIYTANWREDNTIFCAIDKTVIGQETLININLSDFIEKLSQYEFDYYPTTPLPTLPAPRVITPTLHKQITVQYLFQRLNSFLKENSIVIADPGDAMFASMDLMTRGRSEFISPAYYTSLGFAVPASIGAQMACPSHRPIVLVGDGAFQMTGMEISTLARYQLNPIIIVLNNHGYGTERPMLDGAFNDVHPWQFEKIPDVLKTGLGFDVHDECELENALNQAQNNMESFSLLNVHLTDNDRSQPLRQLTEALKQRV